MIYLPLICIISLVLAEPPVGDGYPAARSDYDHDHNRYEHNHDQSYDFRTSPSQEYGPPAARSFGTLSEDLSTGYLPPNPRMSNERSGLSDTYGPPSLRSGLSQEYGVPSVRSSALQSSASRALSTEYGVPNAYSSPSQLYDVPAARSSLSQEYDAPSLNSDIARTPSAEYGVPELRSPSEEYGVPSQRSSGRASSLNDGATVARSSKLSRNSLSQEYGVPSARSGNFKHSHTTPRSFARSFTSSSTRSSKGRSPFGARSLSTSYGAPTARNSGSYTQEDKALSQMYGAPGQRDLSNTYGAPSGSIPSEEYGVPEQYSDLSKQGYSYARNGLEELYNQEPTSYDFSYKVSDYDSGSDFGHAETRQDNRAEGSYFVVLPDGTKQIVEYEADERGFRPRISVEPADDALSGGYDDNAVELARSASGPY